MIKSSNTRVIITIDAELYKKAQEKALIENRSFSNYTVSLIKKDIEQN